MDDVADVVGRHDVPDVDLARIEVDVDPGDARRPAERRVGVAAVGVVVELTPGYGSKRSSIADRPVRPGVGRVGVGEPAAGRGLDLGRGVVAPP